MRPAFTALLLLGIALPRARAQQALLVQKGDVMVQVMDVQEHFPCILENGKLTAIDGNRFQFVPVPEFAPVLVEVQNVKVTDMSTVAEATDIDLGDRFEFSGEFVSPVHLTHVFIALDLHLNGGKHEIFILQIGEMRPGAPKGITLKLPMHDEVKGNYFLHVFAAGRELLNSTMPMDARQKALDLMIANRVAKVVNSGPRPLIAPPPKYPDSLLKSGVVGSALVRLHIEPDGSIKAPSLESATDPAFGAAALDALQSWRFVPAVKNGKPVEVEVELPINFAPPSG